MIIKVCDRCEKQFYPQSENMQAKLPSYNIIKMFGYPMFRNIDLCYDCQKEFENWMKNKSKNKGVK